LCFTICSLTPNLHFSLVQGFSIGHVLTPTPVADAPCNPPGLSGDSWSKIANLPVSPWYKSNRVYQGPTSPISPTQLHLLRQLRTTLPMISTLGVIPPSPAEIAERLAIKMGLVREALISKGEFLADPSIPGRVEWVPCGPGHRLTVKSEDSLALDATDPPPSPVDGATSARSSSGQLPTPDTTPTPSPAPAVPATLAMVVQIVPGKSWLFPDGKWTGPTQFVRQFSDVKLLCTGTAPSHPRFHDDYATSVANLKAIMANIRTKGNPTTGVLSGLDQDIRVRHSLFTVSWPSRPAPDRS